MTAISQSSIDVLEVALERFGALLPSFMDTSEPVSRAGSSQPAAAAQRALRMGGRNSAAPDEQGARANSASPRAEEGEEQKRPAKKRSMSVSELVLEGPVDEAYYRSHLDDVVLCQAGFRRYHARELLKARRKRKKKKENILNELLTTEQQYVQKLGGITQVILEPMLWNAQVSPDPFLPQEKIEAIFSNMKVIYELNQTLLHDLTERISKNWSPSQTVGDVFVSLSPFLDRYSQYYNNHEHAIQELDYCMKRHPKFVDFLQKCRSHPDFVDMQMETLLIEPVQRIPRYILFINDIHKYTDEEHPDKRLLEDAEEAISGVADNINEKMDQIEHMKKVLEVQREITGEYGSLAKLGRKFLRRGDLLKCKLDKNIFTRDTDTVHLVLFTDTLLVTSKTPLGQYALKNQIELRADVVRIKDIPDLSLVQNVFYLITMDKTFTLMASSPEEKAKWTKDIKACLEKAESLFDDRVQIDVTILGSEVRNTDGKKSFTAYKLLVQNENSGAENLVWRRYSEFDKLKRKITKQFPRITFANLPRKHLVGNMSQDVIEARRVMLERYLQEIVMMEDVLKSEVVSNFLELSAVEKLPAQSLKKTAQWTSVASLRVPQKPEQFKFSRQRAPRQVQQEAVVDVGQEDDDDDVI